MALQSPLVYGRFFASQVRLFLPRLLKQGEHASIRRYTRFVTAYCGHSKDFKASKKRFAFGEDAFFVAEDKSSSVLGVADGVGGWRNYGIDPSIFSSALMANCKRLIKEGLLDNPTPVNIMKKGYHELFEHKEPLFGSSTACIIVLDKKNSTLHSANLGDSGFLVIRAGSVVHSSLGQQHYFNTPYQLAIPPPDQEGNVIQDNLDSAEQTSFAVEEGDIVVLGTDGLFDNLSTKQILEEVSKLKNHSVQSIQSAADSLANLAKTLAFDPSYLSPFAKQARRQQGLYVTGGKPDDITVTKKCAFHFTQLERSVRSFFKVEHDTFGDHQTRKCVPN